MLPWRLWEDALGPLSMDFSTWIAAGLMIVVGAVWVIVFNADVLLGLAMRVLGRIRALAPVLKISMAYPLANRFRTGTTMAMFTLVVFTLVTGPCRTAPSSTRSRTRRPSEAVSTCGRHRGNDAHRGRGVGGHSGAPAPAGGLCRVGVPVVPADRGDAEGHRPGAGAVRRARPRPPFLDHTTFDLGKIAEGYESSREVWNAVASQPNLAVVDSLVVPRRDNWNFGAPADFRLTGFYFDEGRSARAGRGARPAGKARASS